MRTTLNEFETVRFHGLDDGGPVVIAEPPPDRRDQVSFRLRRAGFVGCMADRFVTLVSGIAPSHAKPWHIWTRKTLYPVVLLWLFGGAAGSAAIIWAGNLWLLPLLVLTLPITAAGARAGMLTIMHDAIHGSTESPDPGERRWYRWIGNVMSTVLFVEDFTTYAAKHIKHHGAEFATPADPDVRFIRSLGFHPGMPKGQLWKRYRRLRWSPWFHWTYLKERFTAQLGRGPWSRRVIVGTSWLTLIVIIASLGVWTEFLVAWLIPVGLLFQRQALEQFLGEHRWEQIQNPEDSRPKVFALLSAGRFALDAPPEPTLRGAHRLAAWGRWWLKLLGEHALYRGTVVFADLAHHDEHHVHGLLTLHQRGVSLPGYAEPDSAWMNTAYGRRVYQRLKAPEDPTLRNFWDRHSPLDATFEVLSRLEPDDIGPLLRAGETANEMLGM